MGDVFLTLSASQKHRTQAQHHAVIDSLYETFGRLEVLRGDADLLR